MQRPDPFPNMMLTGRDWIGAALLLAGTVLYLLHWPHDFYGFDEGLYLYGSKRVLDGEIMYRDFFEILTPAWFYFMALLYWLFGTSLETARTGMAFVHGGIGALVYLACRRIGVRPVLAGALALMHLTLGYPACSIATPHWLATFLMVALLFAAVGRPGNELRAVLWGILVGVLILVQQQKGAVMAVGAGALILLDWFVERGRGPHLLRRGLAYGLAVLTVVAPVLLFFVIAAGFDEVFRALVTHPLINYRRIHRNIPWGVYWPGLVPHGFIIKYLPLAFLIALGILVRRGRTGVLDSYRNLAVSLVLSLFALLSILYNPNHLHLATVAPLWFVLAGELLERSLRVAEQTRKSFRPVAGALGLLLILACGVQLWLTLSFRWERYVDSTQTPFGRIDHFAKGGSQLLAWLIELIRTTGTKEIFVFPASPGYYLLTGTRNPSRYQILLPVYNDPDQIEEVIATLESRKVPYVIREFYWGWELLTELRRYVQEHYERVPLPFADLQTRFAVSVNRRRPQEGSPAPGYF